VIGGGAAGVMAALRGTLNNKQVLFFPGSPKNKKKSRAQWVSKVENMPGYSQYKKGIVQPHMETIK
jgi:thioredoxin reductase (NADPH)